MCSDGESARSHSFETLESPENKLRGNQKGRGKHERESGEQCLLGHSPGTLHAGSSSITGISVAHSGASVLHAPEKLGPDSPVTEMQESLSYVIQGTMKLRTV